MTQYHDPRTLGEAMCEIRVLREASREHNRVVKERDELRTKLAALEKQDRHVRRLLCIAVADRPYMDDGEASEQEIDYLREPPADIERKLQERGKKRLAAAGAAPVPQGRKITATRIANHLKKSPLGDISMYRNGFFDGAKWAAAPKEPT